MANIVRGPHAASNGAIKGCCKRYVAYIEKHDCMRGANWGSDSMAIKRVEVTVPKLQLLYEAMRKLKGMIPNRSRFY